MATQWYFDERGTVRGPVSARELARLAKTGTVGQQTPVRCGSEGKWVPARKVKGLFDKTKERRGVLAPGPQAARAASSSSGRSAVPALAPEAQDPSRPGPNEGADQPPRSRRWPAYVVSVAAGLLLVLAAWACVAGAGGRQEASRDTGRLARREEQGSDSKVGPRATAKAPKSNDASGDSVTLLGELPVARAPSPKSPGPVVLTLAMTLLVPVSMT